jgi:L-asparaginase/Glu-tRNA(Gln) amidotransferase subunit D
MPRRTTAYQVSFFRVRSREWKLIKLATVRGSPMSTADARVAVFSTGGTIASKRSADGAASPNLTADELVAAVPQLVDVANIGAVSFRRT